MKSYLLSLITLTVFMISACGPSQSEYNALVEENQQLKIELDDCKFGSDKLFAQMKIAFDQEDFSTCKTVFSEIETKHPQSNEYAEAKKLNDQVLSIEAKREEEKRLAEEKAKEEKLKALKKLKKNHDDVSGITWYKNPYFTHYTNTNLLSIYLGQGSFNPIVRLMMSYTGDDWIFFEKAYISYEGQTKEIIFNQYSDKETENSGGAVWEWIDVKADDETIDFLEKFAKSTDAKMRLSGKYSKTRNLSKNERQGIIDVLNGYYLLKEGVAY